MRVIPIKQYAGKIPEGYSLKDFFRFDQIGGECFGVLYSGEKINVNNTKPADKKESSLWARAWGNIKNIF